jgi:hypothetical protein
MNQITSVFDIAVAIAAIIAPFLTIFGWRYVSRNERRLDLVMAAREQLLKNTGVYIDWVRSLRDALAAAAENPSGSEAVNGVAVLLKNETKSWIELVQVRDSEAVFPQARPIREAIIQNHYNLLVPECELACRTQSGASFEAARIVAAEFVQALLALRVATSNSVTRTLFLKHRYSLADPEIRFSIIAVPESEHYGGSTALTRVLEWLKPESMRRSVWLLGGDSGCPEAWSYMAADALAERLPGGRAAKGRWARPLRYFEVGRPIGQRQLSALAEGSGRLLS